MARIRTIKPDFWTDEKVVELSAFARLMFIGMWNFVDDYGRAPLSAKRLKMQILPEDDVDPVKLIEEIRKLGLIVVYEVDGKEFFHVRGFSEHQKVDKRTDSKHPAPPISPELPRTPPNSTSGKGREEEKEGKKKEEREPSGSPPDPRTKLFSESLKTLAAITGKTPDSCRALVGRWLKAVDDEAIHIIAAIEDAARNRIADPVAWITQRLKPREARYGKPSNVIDAADRLLERVRAFDQPIPSELRDGTSPPHVRMLPKG